MSIGSWWCSCCAVNYSNPASMSSNYSGRIVASIQDYSIYSKPTGNQIESTSGFFSYQNQINCSHQQSIQRNGYNNAYNHSPYTPYTETDSWISYAAPECCFSPLQYRESYIPYGRSSETSERIPRILNHSYYEFLPYQDTLPTYKQLNNSGCPLLVDKAKLETLQDKPTKGTNTSSCNRQTRRRNDKKSGIRKHQCSVCFKIFSRQYNLKSHIKIHTKERPYICHYGDCTWTFARPHDLKRHQLLHLDIKPFQCVCGKRFSRSDAYKRHLKSNADCSTMTDYMYFSSCSY